MGKIKLFIANANRKFTDEEISLFKSAAEAAEGFISDNFSFDYDVDLVITSPSFLMNTIPEDGISGRTYNSQLIALVINKQETKITEDAVFETICHEMSHSLRWEKLDEYANTLFKTIILEGLATVLEEKALLETNRQKKQFFLKEVQNTDQATINRMIAMLKNSFDDANYDYDRIFYSGDDSLPRWTAYRLGYYFVKQHLNQSGTTIADATLASYTKFSS
tara:strand:- start:89 stop:751 length:663 start_codon:yes stop_codon:yes gene_type:complete